MSMNNRQILEAECIELGFLYDGDNLFTYNEWKKRGYQVKKGEKCFLKTRLWKTVPPSKEKQKEETNNKDEENKCLMITACLFNINQVEPIK